MLLNYILFVPYVFLLPNVFTSCKWNWKKVLCIGALTSFTIEILQLFGGRYAERDDFIVNTLGALSGYILYVCLLELQKNRKKQSSCEFMTFSTFFVTFMLTNK